LKRTVYLVEDEPLARESLRRLVAETDWLDPVGEADDGLRAIAGIDSVRPDLVFLDVELPEVSGIDVLERITHRPAVVFTTAYERYAVAAFELGAIDYLVKPFGRKRFHATLARVRERLSAFPPAGPGPDTDRAREALRTATPLRRIYARRGPRIVPIALDDVVEIRAADDYSEVLASGEHYLLNVGLNELESRLDGERFLRIHRSSIINVDHVVAIEPHDDRRVAVVLKDGRRRIASRRGSLRLRALAD
jgi:two-component system, LytTR family, response regulator